MSAMTKEFHQERFDKLVAAELDPVLSVEEAVRLTASQEAMETAMLQLMPACRNEAVCFLLTVMVRIATRSPPSPFPLKVLRDLLEAQYAAGGLAEISILHLEGLQPSMAKPGQA